MARSGLAFVVLLCVLAGGKGKGACDQASTGGQVAASCAGGVASLAGVEEGKHACDPAGTAAQVASSCAAGVASGVCCQALLSPVHQGGGVPCLCRVAEQAQAGNFSDLYRSCTGGLRGGGSDLAAMCRDVPPPSLQVPEAELRCDALKLASAIGKSCDADANTTSTDCCNAVVASVETKGCLCSVIDHTIIVGSPTTTLEDILQLYKSCGGPRQLNSTMDCADVENYPYNSPPPSPTVSIVPVRVPPSGESTHPAVASDNGSSQAQAATPTPSGDHESKKQLHVSEAILFFVIVIVCILGGIPLTIIYRTMKKKRTEVRRVVIQDTVETALQGRLPPAIQELLPPAIQQSVEAMVQRVPEIVAQQVAQRLPELAAEVARRISRN